jgi:peptidyl-prolyl cis-trans isomerase C
MTFSQTIRRGTAALALAATFAAAPPAFAEDPSPDTVVARVDGAPITEGDVTIAATDFRDQMAQVPAEQRRGQLIELLVEIKLAAKAAESLGLDKDPTTVKRLQQARDRALRVEFIRAKVLGPVTEEAMHKRFDEEVAKFKPADQYSASHILVKTEDEAKAVIADLDKGGDFAAIAKEKSLDPGSKDSGGDLGFFAEGQMVKPFEDAVKALEVGKYTETPVQTQFGWHVIKLDGKRKEPAPTFEDQAADIHNAMVQELFVSTMDDLRSKAKVEIVGAPADKPADQPAPAPAK